MKVSGWTEQGRILVEGADGLPLGGEEDEDKDYTAACCPETFGFEVKKVFTYTIPKGDSEV